MLVGVSATDEAIFDGQKDFLINLTAVDLRQPGCEGRLGYLKGHLGGRHAAIEIGDGAGKFLSIRLNPDGQTNLAPQSAWRSIEIPYLPTISWAFWKLDRSMTSSVVSMMDSNTRLMVKNALPGEFCNDITPRHQATTPPLQPRRSSRNGSKSPAIPRGR